MARLALVRLAPLAMLAAPTLLAAQMQSKPLDPANMDTTCSACQDFYRYANGSWIKRNPIPGDKPMWSSFHELQDQNFAALREVLDAAAKDARTTKDADQRKLGLFYGSCMDSTAIEAAGIKPLAGDLGRIAAIRNRKQTETELARLHRQFVSAGFFFHSTPDAKKSERTIAEIYQSGLGLPDRDYYLKTDSASESLRAQYVDHVARILRLAGDDSAASARAAAQVMELETALAKASMTQEAQRDPEAVYHLHSLAELKRAAPAFGWDAYFKELGMTGPAQVNVAQPVFLKTVDSLLASAPVEQWRTYLRWRLLDTASPFLSSPFVNESFRFNSTVLQGTAEQQPRWKRCLQFTDGFMGEILGQAYVKKHFTPEAKARALEMVRNIQAEFRARLAQLTWMGESTKEKAYRKLDAIVNRIGYPDKWRDYSKLEVQPTTFFTNVARAAAFEAAARIRQGGQADRPGRVGHDASDGERLLQPVAQRDHVPGRHHAATVLRSQGGRRGELWRDGCRHRSRDHPWIRRPGAPIRRPRQPERVVGFHRQQGVQRACANDGEAGRRVLADRHAQDERQAHPGREHRRPRRAPDRVRRLPQIARGQARAGPDRRPHRQPALLPGVGADLAQQHPPGVRASSSDSGSARGQRVSGQRAVQQHGRLREGLRLQGRRPDGASRQPPGADLVERPLPWRHDHPI